MDIDELARLAAKDRRARRGREPDYPKVATFSLLIIFGWIIMFEIALQALARWGAVMVWEPPTALRLARVMKG